MTVHIRPGLNGDDGMKAFSVIAKTAMEAVMEVVAVEGFSDDADKAVAPSLLVQGTVNAVFDRFDDEEFALKICAFAMSQSLAALAVRVECPGALIDFIGRHAMECVERHRGALTLPDGEKAN